MRQSKIPTIIAILLLLGGVAAGVFLISTRQIFKLGASPDVAPQDVRISNIGSTSFTVSWITDKATIGYLEYGKSESLGQTTQAESTPSSFHFVNVNSLSPSTSYFFKINSGGASYDNSGLSWNRKKRGTGLAQPILISGSVTDALGAPASGIIVYATVTNASIFASQTTANGSWLISLNNSSVTKDTLVQIFVQGGAKGIASAQVIASSANPAPIIKLGQTYDFRNQGAVTSTTSANPTSSIIIPETTTQVATQSGFNVINSGATSPKTVTLQSTTEGETLTSAKPQFFWSGPAGTKITISVHSNTPINGTTTVDTTGSWNWIPPTNLDPGTHTITLSWKNASGILQTLTRTFVVSAAEGPAFVGTPSATPKITPLPTIIPTEVPRIIIPATTSGTPVSGVGTPTIILISVAILLLAGGAIMYIKLEN